MKNLLKTFFVIVFLCFSDIHVFAQTLMQHTHDQTHGAQTTQPILTIQTVFDQDSLLGYDEAGARQHANIGGVLGLDLNNFINYTKRNYINKKYNLNGTSGNGARPGNPTPQTPCTNVDFETGTTTGWVVTGDVVNTSGGALDPYGSFPEVCPGGNFSLKLGNATNPTTSSARQTFAVTAANAYYLLKMAMVILNFPHTAGDAAKVNIRFFDQSNNIIPCPVFECYYADNSAGVGSSYGLTGFQTGANGVNIGNQSYPTTYIPWTNVGFDLTPYIGQNVTIEIQNKWCVYNYDWAYTYVDGQCAQLTTNVIGGCAGTTGTLTAPGGMTSYTWAGPPTSTVSTVHVQTVMSSVPGTYTVQCTPYSSCGTAIYTYTMALLTSGSPLANFTFTTSACQNSFSVPFADNSSANGGGAIINYYWDFDNNGTVDNTTANTSHVFPSAGTYTTELKVSNGGCFDSITKVITLTSGFTSNFILSNSCLGIVSNFTSTSTPTVSLVSQIWNWGDGTGVGMGAGPSHTYATAGTYTVKLLVIDAGLCKDSIAKTITIFPKPTISFTANPVCLNTATTFTNSSVITPTSTISGWSWDFDNNGTVDNTTQSPTKTYSAAGTYSVELKATSNNGCSDSTTIAVQVNALPTATFSPANACIGTNVLLNNTSSVPLPDNISLYNWNFGAGSNPTSSSIQTPPSLTYNSSGVKTITLDITSNTTCSASITQTLTIYPSPTASFSTSSVCQGIGTTFTDQSSAGTGTVTSWSWDYTTDGTVDNTTQSPSYTYPSSGTFTTSLVASTSNGCSQSFSLAVNVWGHALPNFSPDNVCYGTATTFTNLTNTTTNANVGTTPTYDWAFADGSPNANAINPIHSYTLGTNGNAIYNVTLTATSSHNCIDNIVKQVHVYSVPTASFSSNIVCYGTATQHTDASNGNGNAINAYQWDFLSNGTVDASGVSTANYIYPGYGTNMVSYTVSTTPTVGLTCSNAISTLTVYVNPSPVPDFSYLNKCINNQPNTFDGSLSSIAVGTNTNYAWAFGDGSTTASATPTVSHNYSSPATYNVTLTVTSNNGCLGQVIKAIDVYKKPIMTISHSSACDGKAMTFTAVEQAGSGTVTDWFWDYNNNLSTIEANGQATVSYIYPSAGSQTVALISVSSPGQCRDTLKVPVYVDYVPKAQFLVDKPAGCPIHCVTFTTTTAAITGPGQINDWKWDYGDGTTTDASTGSPQNHCYNNTTSNQLSHYDVKLVVTTDKGCSDSLTQLSFITVYPTPIASYTINPDPGNVVTPLEYFINQSQDYSKWWWSFGDGPYKTDSLNVNPTHLYSDETAQSYHTNLIVMNQYGCRDTAYVSIDINPEFTFYIPNAFTPANSDHVNDLFSGKGIGIEKYDMWIFDRWGEMIYYSNDIAKGWDGKKTGKPEEVQQDVYTWKVKIKDVLGKNHQYVGHVTLLK